MVCLFFEFRLFFSDGLGVVGGIFSGYFSCLNSFSFIGFYVLFFCVGRSGRVENLV